MIKEAPDFQIAIPFTASHTRSYLLHECFHNGNVHDRRKREGVILQKKSLRSLYDDKLKALMDKLLNLDGDFERDVCFEDFVWANSIFWARALNIPLPHTYVFPEVEEDKNCGVSNGKISDESTTYMINDINDKESQVDGADILVDGVASISKQKDTVWVEGLVPGIDFCNHGLKPAATWEVDGTGSSTRVPFSMYLLSAGQPLETGEEISISYGNKANEELLHLYGFVLDGNPDDYLMVHYPVQALQNVSFSESKAQLLEAQKAEMRCLLPRTLLDHGFFPVGISTGEGSHKGQLDRVCSYSWSGQRKMPSYLNKLVFPENFLTTLRTIAMKEDELFQVSSLLEELVTSGGGRQPSDSEVRAAIWEACGDSGALQMLVDLLTMRMVDLQDGSGTEDSDTNLLKNARISETRTLQSVHVNDLSEINGIQQPQLMSRNKWSSIVYRRGQKQLTRLFLKEAEHALQLSLHEGN
ncbi:uncharacterized protein LOC126801931 isoform X2 [Argentina anserina]|uniref:uncharacterized protein LOC126801931 isoform X2 n=1 Tax=Argentina anserina TaxID=57926 RepID=UPI0021763416|nr:uncharacterized protein LOC126801931 isoform X2 [Potentilla anserina]